jgi:hypothetical protein
VTLIGILLIDALMAGRGVAGVGNPSLQAWMSPPSKSHPCLPLMQSGCLTHGRQEYRSFFDYFVRGLWPGWP